MKKVYLATVTILTLTLVGCGGGGSSSNANGVKDNNGTDVALKGTVPGTLIEAFCDNNSYHKINSVNNGTAKHPFTLKLPKGVPCRIAMTMNESDPTNRITTPIEFKQGNKKTTSVKLTNDTDIGYVPLPNVSTAAVDANGDHVKDTPLSVDVNGSSAQVFDDNKTNPFDTNHNGKIDGFEDQNHNGIIDGFENKNGNYDPVKAVTQDTNKDGIPDGYEKGKHSQDNNSGN